MKKVIAVLEIDETTIHDTTGDNESSILSLTEREMGWVKESGIGVLSMSDVEEGKSYTVDIRSGMYQPIVEI